MILLNAPHTAPFGAALMLLVALGVLEGAGLLISISPSHFLDALLPEIPDGADGPLGWLHLGKVPVLVLLVLFLAGFALTGYVVQGGMFAFSGQALPAWLACIPAALAGLSSASALGGLLAHWIPQDETSAVSEQSLIGRAGIVMRGIAREGLAAEVKVRDMHGRSHYVMAEPDIAGQTFGEGDAVLLVKKQGALFRCIGNPHPELL